MKPATISLLVPAAGRGARAKADRNKVLQPLAGRPLLWWTLQALTAAGTLPDFVTALEVILAIDPAERSAVLAAIDGATALPVKLVEGGANRQQSVANAAAAAGGQWLLIHDAARPLVPPDRIAAVIAAALQTGAAILAAPASDTIKQSRPDHTVAATRDRSQFWLAQTPQVFRADIFHQALRRAEADGFDGTDCASLVERLIDEHGKPLHPVSLVDGGRHNLKVTYPEDFRWAAAWLAQGNSNR